MNISRNLNQFIFIIIYYISNLIYNAFTIQLSKLFDEMKNFMKGYKIIFYLLVEININGYKTAIVRWNVNNIIIIKKNLIVL